MTTFKNVISAADFVSRLIPASVHHFPKGTTGEDGEGPGRWDNFWPRPDASVSNPEAKTPLLIKVERPLSLTTDQAVSVGVAFDRGRTIPGSEQSSRDLLILKIRPCSGDVTNLAPLELRYIEWGENEDGVWTRHPAVFQFRWFGDGCRGVLFFNPPGETPRITIVPENRQILWEGPAVVRFPEILPEGVRHANYNGVKYAFPGGNRTIEIYDGRRNAYSAWGRVQHVRKTLPDLARGGTRSFEYFMVADDPAIQPAAVRHLLTEEGLRQVG